MLLLHVVRMQSNLSAYWTLGMGICDIYPLQGKFPLLLHCPNSFSTHVLQPSVEPVCDWQETFLALPSESASASSYPGLTKGT